MLDKLKGIAGDEITVADSHTQSIEMKITGMTCDQCASSIEKVVNHLDGISKNSVNYSEGKGAFSFNSATVSARQIKDAIHDKTSFKVSNITENNHDPLARSNEAALVKKAVPEHHDLIIIGGGSAAFSAATTAADIGLSVLMINAGLDIGGTCVNVGCVPSKHLIRVAEQIYHAKNSPFNGVSSASPEVDFKKTIQQKKELVATLQKKKYLDVVSGLEHVTIVEGWARFVDAHTVDVDGKLYKGVKFLLATGATTKVPEIKGLNEVGYFTNVSLFDSEEQPEHLIVIGAGYIALEIAQAYHRLGSKVTILHRSDRILRAQAADITDDLTTHFRNEGIDIRTDVKISEFTKDGNTIKAHTNGGIIEASHILVATGTKPNTFSLDIENSKVELDEQGFVVVNDRQETNIGHIYGAGDCTNTPAFVYTAAKEGKVAVLNAFKSVNEKVDYTALPWVVFTDPQIAGAGLDEKEAEKAGIPFETSVMPLTDIPRAQAALDTRGFIKLIRNSQTDKLIGGRIIAPEGGELAMQISLAIKGGLTISDLADMFHPYLTLSEGVKLAAITFNKDVAELSCCAS